VFNSALGPNNIDTITRYNVSQDTILLEDAIFSALTGTTTLPSSAFVWGSAATTSAHRIVYNTATGALLYDADGSGAGAAVQFATLTAVMGVVTSAEFQII
jgi:serralysin